MGTVTGWRRTPRQGSARVEERGRWAEVVILSRKMYDMWFGGGLRIGHCC